LATSGGGGGKGNINNNFRSDPPERSVGILVPRGQFYCHNFTG
jgi:hypothetical protein